MEIKWYIFLSVILFCIGVIGALTRRNSIIVFMCIELMLNSVNLLLIAFSKMHLVAPNAFAGTMATSAQIFVFFIMIVAAAEVSVGIDIIVMLYRNTRSIDINFLNRLKN
jgi:NADH-quinone oxidoreductase subunit K